MVIASFRAPPELDLVERLLDPLRFFLRPRYVGLERVPDERPLLFVGNHTLFGLLDTPFLVADMWARRRILLRALGDHIHFEIPVWGRLLERYGTVDGTRENCAALMRQGEAILVFPGGAREVNKRKGEKHTLLWGDRLGFARLAVGHGCTIVPFASIGPDDAFDILLDAGDALSSPFGPGLRNRAGRKAEIIAPLVRGVGPTPLPRLERLYYHFGEPIPTAHLGGDQGDIEAARAVRDATRSAVEAGIETLLRLRESDPLRSTASRVLRGVGDIASGHRPASPDAERG